jgi:tRNA-2-methylthio-N6-dimethylallyladenosine synthase
MNGCDNFCAYCIVPYVRGREVSRDYHDILTEIRELEKKGVREITLLGQNVNSYAYQDGKQLVTFPQLLRMITKEISSIVWIRFMSSHPKDFSPELIECIREEDAVCSHVHLPLQSGSTEVLKAMNRKYTAQQYLELADTLKKEVPGITFTADIMVGFPGERNEDHRQTLEMMRSVGYIDAFMYYFNPREGTKAARMQEQLSDSLKLARLQEVIDLQKQLSAEHKQRQIGSTVSVMCDTLSKRNESEYVGHTEHGERIVFPRVEELVPGDVVDVKITEVSGNTYRGEMLCLGKQ